MNNYQWIISLATTVVTLIGIFLAYYGIKRNFRNEVSKIKQKVAIDAMQELPYEICNLMAMMTDKKSNLNQNVKSLRNILFKIISYGSKDAVKLAILMQQLAYKKERTKTDGHIQLAAYSLLIVQVKYDLTSEIISPESYFKIQLTDYETTKDIFASKMNKIIEDLELNSKFLIKN